MAAGDLTIAKTAAPNKAALETALTGDNRSVVASYLPASPVDKDKWVVATDVIPDGKDHQYSKGRKADGTLDTPVTLTGVADKATVDVAATPVTAKIYTVPQGGGGLTKNELRTQYFHTGKYDASKVAFGAKRCFVNLKGQPLKTDGTPADDVAGAQDADAGDLTSIGEAVTNWAQVNLTDDAKRTPPPGDYGIDPRQTSVYAPYVGWTAQNTYRMVNQ